MDTFVFSIVHENTVGNPGREIIGILIQGRPCWHATSVDSRRGKTIPANIGYTVYSFIVDVNKVCNVGVSYVVSNCCI
jgi:hypothetical protein